jgi:signal transduction histidine kinase
MAAVRRIVEAHRGSMEVGADPDRGVVITLSIPSASTLAAGSAATP